MSDDPAKGEADPRVAAVELALLRLKWPAHMDGKRVRVAELLRVLAEEMRAEQASTAGISDRYLRLADQYASTVRVGEEAVRIVRLLADNPEIVALFWGRRRDPQGVEP